MTQNVKTFSPDAVLGDDTVYQETYRANFKYVVSGSTLGYQSPIPQVAATRTASGYKEIPFRDPVEDVEQVRQKAEHIFRKAREEFFEDGMESNFSKAVVSLIEKCSNTAVKILSELILNEQVDPEAASEALRWVGNMEHLETYRSRRELLEKSLLCLSARVRDGAGLGLASMDDPHAIPHLKKAVEQELNPELRHDLELVLKQLERLQ